MMEEKYDVVTVVVTKSTLDILVIGCVGRKGIFA
jgi:hypothetical protein